jgi:hypothetical protein
MSRPTFVLKKKDELTMAQMENVNKSLFRQKIESVVDCNSLSFSFSNTLVDIRTYKKFYKISFHAYVKHDGGGIGMSEDEFKMASETLFDIFSFPDMPHRVIQPYSTRDYDATRKTYGIYAVDKESFEAENAMKMFDELLKSSGGGSGVGSDADYHKVDVFSLNNFFVISLDELMTRIKSLPYHCSVELFTSLWKQLCYMIHKNINVLTFDISRIILFRGRFMYLFNAEELLHIIDERKMNVRVEDMVAYGSGVVYAPELTELMKKSGFPSMVHITAPYYSLGMITLQSLFAFDGKQIGDNTEERLDQIIDTKLYFAIKRACDENPRTRKLLYI